MRRSAKHLRSHAPLIRDRHGLERSRVCDHCVLRRARDTKSSCRARERVKNDLTRVTRIFQKRAASKTAHDARAGDRRGLFCRAVRGRDPLEK
jgi:hypothetical protein